MILGLGVFGTGLGIMLMVFLGEIDINQGLGAGALTGLFVAMGTVFTMLIRQNNQLRRERDEEIVGLKKEATERELRFNKDIRKANRRIDMLVTIVRQGGLSIPPEVWSDDI